MTRGRMTALLAAATAVGARTPEVEFLCARHDVYRRGGAPRDVAAPIPTRRSVARERWSSPRSTGALPRTDSSKVRCTARQTMQAEIDFQRAAAEAAGAEIARSAAPIDKDVQRIDRQDREISEQLDRLAEEQRPRR